MNKFIILLAAGLVVLPDRGAAAQTAQARLFCLSPKFQQGRSESAWYSLELTTITASINGELAPVDIFDTGRTHSSWLVVIDELFDGEIQGAMALNVPLGADANANGFADFFEVSQAVSAASSGVYNIPGLGSGTVEAIWDRAAGSTTGTCVLKFRPVPWIAWETFTHTFELIEFTGPASYTPGANTVTGAVNLAQTGIPENFLQGPVVFVKSPANRFNELELQAGTWTNAHAQPRSHTNDWFRRDPAWPTNYYGFIEFYDGDPNTGEPDYRLWMLSLDDQNDRDRDGIPDFSDDPVLPRRPLLALTSGPANLWLNISGDVGRLHEIQAADSLSSTNWQPVLSLTLTNDPQAVSIPRPVTMQRYWRVRAQ